MASKHHSDPWLNDKQRAYNPEVKTSGSLVAVLVALSKVLSGILYFIVTTKGSEVDTTIQHPVDERGSESTLWWEFDPTDPRNGQGPTRQNRERF